FSSNRIKAVRDQMGLNLEQLSELSGISMSHLNRLENGTRRASVDLIDKIAAALKVPRGKLLDTGTRTETITVKHRLQPLEKSEMPTEEWTDVSLPTMPPYTDVEKHAGIVRGPCM